MLFARWDAREVTAGGGLPSRGGTPPKAARLLFGKARTPAPKPAAVGRPTPAAREEEELSEWLARVRPPVEPDLIKQAVQVLDRIVGENSELRELWEESDELSEWEATVVTLRSRLQV